MYKTYDTVIQEQIQNKIIDRVSNNKISISKNSIFPIKLNLQKAESTKLRVFSDAWMKSETDFSLNDCLGKGTFSK